MKLKERIVTIAAPLAAAFVAVSGAAVLLSWAAGRPDALRIMSNSIPMPPVAADVFTALSVFFLRAKIRALRIAAAVCAAFVGVCATVLFSAWISGVQFDLENIVAAMPDAVLGVTIGRMSPVGMFFFMILASALTAYAVSGGKRSRTYADAAGLFVLVGSSVVLTGYWYGAPLLYGGNFIPLPFASAAVFFVLSCALLFISPDALFSRIMTGTTVFASFMRYIVPALTGVTMLSGWLVLNHGASLHRHDRVIIDSLVAILSVAILTVVSIIISRRAGHRLQESEARLTATLRSIGDGVIATDASGNVISLNAVAEVLTGWTAAEAFGKPLAEIFHIVHAQTRRAAENPVDRVLKEGIIVGLANHTALIARGGNERQIADSAAPIRDAAGSIVGTVLVFRDVSDEYAMRERVVKSEDQYRLLFSEMTAGFALHEIICNASGTPVDYRFLSVNSTFEKMTGLKSTDIIGKTVREVMPDTEAVWIEKYGRVALTGETFEFENFAGALGKYFDVRAYCPKRGTFAVIFQDITGRKRDENERTATMEILRLINSRSDTHELIRAVTMYLKEWSGCEAVGIRLAEGDDYPYFETRGFPAEFVSAENTLCERDAQGRVVRDSVGNPALDCMCGNILQGRFDPSKPFFTRYGSFWSNCTTELLASTTEADRQARTRNRCNGEGYESVALVPLRFGATTLGLIQINDHRRDRFTESYIHMLERMADSLAVALTQRMAEAQLAKAHERLSLSARAARLGIWDWDIPKNELVWDDRMYELYGIDRADFAGAYEAWLAGIHPDDRAASDELSQQVRRGEREYDTEFRVVWPNGTIRYLKAHGLLIRAANGDPLRMTGVNFDITEQKQAEIEIHDRGMMLQCLWKISQFKAKNVQEILDFTLTEAIALTGSAIGYIYHYSEEKKEFTLNTWSHEVMKECSIMNPQTVYMLEKTGVWGEAVRQRKPIIVNDFKSPNPHLRGYPEGHVRLSTFLTVPIFAGERIVAVAGMGNKTNGYSEQDVQTLSHLMDAAWKIVERFEAQEAVKKHEAALVQADKLKSLGVLATGIAHEINQPLMAISMAMDSMLLKPEDSAFAAVKIGAMKGYISRITQIVEQVRTFAREQHEDTGGEFSVNDAVRNVLGMIGTQLKNNSILVSESLDENVPYCRGNLYRFEQVVLNLLSNARDALRERIADDSAHTGEISIRTAVNGATVLTIRDNGSGMSDEVKRNLFTPFFTTKPEGVGTGLGLSITYGIVKSMGGDITVVSEAGAFTEFTVTLPAVK